MKLALCVLLLAALAHARVERVYPKRGYTRSASDGRDITPQHQPHIQTHEQEHHEDLERKEDHGHIQEDHHDHIQGDHHDHIQENHHQGRFQGRTRRQSFSYGGGISSGNSGEDFEHSDLSDNNFDGYYAGFRGDEYYK